MGCVGKGGLDAHLVAQAILQGVKDATRQANLNNIKRINIVLMKIHIFLAFKAMAQQLFGRFTQTAGEKIHICYYNSYINYISSIREQSCLCP